MKKITILSIIILITQSCNLYSKDERLLAELKRTNGTKIKIYFVTVGATANDNIQVRNDGQDNPLWVSEKYNFLSSSKLIGDALLQLIMTDTGYQKNNEKMDTVLVKLK